MKFSKLLINIFVVSVLVSMVFKSRASVSEPKPEAPQKLLSLGQKQFPYSSDITHKVAGSTIKTQFAPTNKQGEKIDLSQLAATLGYDHFNWANYVVQDPHGITDQQGQKLHTPYNDPPKGGYIYDAADQLPFYWDMEPCQQCKSRHHWQNQHNSRQFELVFQDSPVDYRLQPGEKIEFITSLVGVKEYDSTTQTATWEVLHTFRWQLTNPHSHSSQVLLTETDVALDQLSPILLSTMQLDGAILNHNH